MALPLLVAFVAVLLGTLLAVGPREGTALVRPIRVLALLAALFVIATHLLPEAFHELGPSAALGLLAGALFPTISEWVGARFAARIAGARDSGARLGLEVAYGGLLLHRFGDGLSMGAVANRPSVVLALALHIVPVTTVMVLAVESLLGRRVALIRGGVLAVATMGGVVVGSVLVSSSGDELLSPWLSAVVAGLLLHIVSHDVPRAHAHGTGKTKGHPSGHPDGAAGHAPPP